MEDKKESKKIVLATPVHDTTSSVFLTPPLSDKPSKTTDMVPQKFPLIQNLILTPTSPAEVAMTEEADIVTRFYLQGFPLILEKIFSHLSPADLKSCVTVCSRWRLFCKNLKPIANRLADIVVEKEKPKRKKQAGRQPLLIRNRNVMPEQKAIPPSIPRVKHTKCPNCSSPAKQYTFTKAECCTCSHSFCPTCLGKAHDKSCSRRSPTKRDSTQLSIGTKQSKKRLRRL